MSGPLPNLIPIDDANDPRLAPYRAVRDRDLRERAQAGSGHGGRFVAEGEVVLDALLRRSLYPPESLLIAESRVSGADAIATRLTASRRPTPLPARLTAEEAAAHAQFIAVMGDDALWQRYADQATAP